MRPSASSGCACCKAGAILSDYATLMLEILRDNARPRQRYHYQGTARECQVTYPVLMDRSFGVPERVISCHANKTPNPLILAVEASQ